MKFKVSSLFCKQCVENKRKKNNLLQAISLICMRMDWNVVLFLWFLHYFQTFWLQSWIPCLKLKEKEPGTEAMKQKGTNNSLNKKFTSRFWDSQAEGYPASSLCILGSTEELEIYQNVEILWKQTDAWWAWFPHEHRVSTGAQGFTCTWNLNLSITYGITNEESWENNFNWFKRL